MGQRWSRESGYEVEEGVYGSAADESTVSSLCNDADVAMCDASFQKVHQQQSSNSISHKCGSVIRRAAAFLRTSSGCRLQAVSHYFREILCVLLEPDVKRRLSDPRPIVREMAYRSLEAAALQGSAEAVRIVIGIALSENEESQELRKWALEGLALIAEPGEAWALNVIARPGGPLQSTNRNIRVKAVSMLGKINTGQTDSTRAVQLMRSDEDMAVREAVDGFLLNRSMHIQRMNRGKEPC